MGSTAVQTPVTGGKMTTKSSLVMSTSIAQCNLGAPTDHQEMFDAVVVHFEG
jgi:hypothetical protein